MFIYFDIILLYYWTGSCYVWHGAKSPLHNQQRATQCAECIKQRRPLELSLQSSDVVIKEMSEGKEWVEFWDALGSTDRSQYCSLLSGKRIWILNKSILPNGILDFCKQKFPAPPLVPMCHLVCIAVLIVKRCWIFWNLNTKNNDKNQITVV